jgi:tetratricopeptide (TPR) repeat protein
VLAAKFRLLMRQGHFGEAVDTFRRLLDVDSSSAGIAAEFVQCARCWGPTEEAAPLLERTARLNPLAPNREVIYATLGRMLIMLGRDADAVPWLEQAWDIVRLIPPSEVMARDADNFTIENVKVYLAAAYAYTGRIEEARSRMISALASDRTNDFTIRQFLNQIPAYLSPGQRAQEERLAEGFRRAGLRDHLDETEDFHILSASFLQNNPDNPTPMDLPGATAVTTPEMQHLLRTTPKLLILTASPANPTIPGSIFVLPPSGRLDDDWQTTLGTLMEKATNGDKEWPIVTFAYSIYHWQARNLALRLLALGYKRVYWYRGGWEAWDSHDLAKSPLTVQFAPRDQASTQVTPASR